MKPIFGILCAAALTCSGVGATTLLSLSPATIPANAGDVGDAFDVLLTNNGPSSISVQSFSFEVSVVNPNITFTGANFATVASTYIFAGDSFDEMNGFTLNITSPGQILDANDGTNDGAGVSLNSGQTLALGHILFDVTGGAAAGPITVSFTGGSAENNLTDPQGANISIDTITGGTININGVSSVPEPSSLPLMLAGTAALAALIRRRRT